MNALLGQEAKANGGLGRDGRGQGGVKALDGVGEEGGDFSGALAGAHQLGRGSFDGHDRYPWWGSDRRLC